MTDLGSPIDPNLQTLLRYLPWSSPGNSAPPASPASASTNDGFQGPPMPQISQLVGFSTAPPPIPSSPQMSLVGGDLMARFDSPVTPPQAVSVVNADAAGPIDAPSVSSTPRASIQPAPVPEPSALALLLAVTLGVGARAVYRRRCA